MYVVYFQLIFLFLKLNLLICFVSSLSLNSSILFSLELVCLYFVCLQFKLKKISSQKYFLYLKLKLIKFKFKLNTLCTQFIFSLFSMHWGGDRIDLLVFICWWLAHVLVVAVFFYIRNQIKFKEGLQRLNFQIKD